MKANLKKFRVAAGLTQSKIATAVGVTQPNYHRWEAGSAPIPPTKLKKLAKVLKASPDAILGRHPPIEATFYDDSASPELNYYGEVAVHFRGRGEPLLLSISDAAFRQLHRDLQQEVSFVTVKSLANQTVAIRVESIADLYFSSEAHDYYGPEHDTYTNYASVQIPDTRDWEIVEALAADGIGLEDFDPKDVERVQKMVMITDEQYERLVADGAIKAEELESERVKNDLKTQHIFDLAHKTTYQLSTGQRRSVWVDDDANLYNAFYDLTDFDGGDPDDHMIRLEAEGWHQIIFINQSALDYVALPTHRYEKGRVDAAAADIDASRK